MVALGASQRSPAFDVVRSADDIGIALAVEHLVGLGHPRVAYVHCGAMPAAGIRMRGYIRAASAADFEADVVSVPGPDYAEESGAAAGRILLARDELPTAVVTGTAGHYSLLMDSSDPRPQDRPDGPFRTQCTAETSYPSVTKSGALVLSSGPPLSRAGRDIAGHITPGEPRRPRLSVCRLARDSIFSYI
jgi:hypothetical protein